MEDKDLKITALTQRIGEITSQYEDKIADLRVAITRQEETINDLNGQAQSLAEQNVSQPYDEEPEVVEGEVI